MRSERSGRKNKTGKRIDRFAHLGCPMKNRPAVVPEYPTAEGSLLGPSHDAIILQPLPLAAIQIT